MIHFKTKVYAILYADRGTHQCWDLLPSPHNFHMLEGFYAFWQTLLHGPGPWLPQPLSKEQIQEALKCEVTYLPYKNGNDQKQP